MKGKNMGGYYPVSYRSNSSGGAGFQSAAQNLAYLSAGAAARAGISTFTNATFQVGARGVIGRLAAGGAAELAVGSLSAMNGMAAGGALAGAAAAASGAVVAGLALYGLYEWYSGQSWFGVNQITVVPAMDGWTQVGGLGLPCTYPGTNEGMSWRGATGCIAIYVAPPYYPTTSPIVSTTQTAFAWKLKSNGWSFVYQKWTKDDPNDTRIPSQFGYTAVNPTIIPLDASPPDPWRVLPQLDPMQLPVNAPVQPYPEVPWRAMPGKYRPVNPWRSPVEQPVRRYDVETVPSVPVDPALEPIIIPGIGVIILPHTAVEAPTAQELAQVEATPGSRIHDIRFIDIPPVGPSKPGQGTEVVRPEKPGTGRDRKGTISTGKVGAAFGYITEMKDANDALYKALPKECKLGRFDSKTQWNKAKATAKCLANGKLDADYFRRALIEVITNEIVDYLYGKAGQYVKMGVNVAGDQGYWVRPVGAQFGARFWPRAQIRQDMRHSLDRDYIHDAVELGVNEWFNR